MSEIAVDGRKWEITKQHVLRELDKAGLRWVVDDNAINHLVLTEYRKLYERTT